MKSQINHKDSNARGSNGNLCGFGFPPSFVHRFAFNKYLNFPPNRPNEQMNNS